jgi:hypothetical protein
MELQDKGMNAASLKGEGTQARMPWPEPKRRSFDSL